MPFNHLPFFFMPLPSSCGAHASIILAKKEKPFLPSSSSEREYSFKRYFHPWKRNVNVVSNCAQLYAILIKYLAFPFSFRNESFSTRTNLEQRNELGIRATFRSIPWRRDARRIEGKFVDFSLDERRRGKTEKNWFRSTPVSISCCTMARERSGVEKGIDRGPPRTFLRSVYR